MKNVSGACGAAILTIATLTLSLSCYGQVPSNALLRTLQIGFPSKSGTKPAGSAFTVDVDGRQYLLTARHVVESVSSGAHTIIAIRKITGWSELEVEVFKCSGSTDIAVLIPERQLTVAYSLPPTADGVLLGQDVYFVGFPDNLPATVYQGTSMRPGIVKKATLAQFEVMPEIHSGRLVLDGFNSSGLSGSPVVFRDLNMSGYTFKVAGVISAFQSELSPVLRKREIDPKDVTPADQEHGRAVQAPDGKWYKLEETGDLVALNSGIAIAWNIAPAIDLIHKHPSGPTVDDSFKPE